MTNLTIVVPAYGRPHRTAQTLLSIEEQTQPELVSNVIVVESVSSSSSSLADLFSSLTTDMRIPTRLVVTEDEIGIAKARNLGASGSSSDLICFLDSDCIVTHGWLSELVRVLESEPSIAAVQAAKVDGLSGRIGCGRLVSANCNQVPFSGLRDLLDTDCLLVRRSAFNAIPFDEQFIIGWEDADWSLRARAAGHALFGCATARVIHNHSRHEHQTGYWAHRWNTDTIDSATAHFVAKWGFDPRKLTTGDYQRATGREVVRVAGIPGYRPNPDDFEDSGMRLHLNENFCSPPPVLVENLRKSFLSSSVSTLRTYDYQAQKQAILLLSRLFNVQESTIRLSEGASGGLADILAMLRPFITTAVVLTPAWPQYKGLLLSLGYQILDCPFYRLDDRIGVDWDILDKTLAKAKVPAVIITSSPHMPTGHSLRVEDYGRLRQLAIRYDARVVLDQVYSGFNGDSLEIGEISKTREFFRIRSLSKLFGLADLRLGYVFLQESFAKKSVVNYSGLNPFGIGRLRSLAMVCAFQHVDDLDRISLTIKALRAELLGRLARSKSLHVYPSSANFLLIKCLQGAEAADSIRKALGVRSIKIRQCNGYDLPDCLRVTVPSSSEDIALVENAFIDALGER